ANVVADTLIRKERVKPKRERALSMMIQSGIKEKLLAAQSEATKEENAPAEMLHSLDQQMEKRGDGGLYFMDRIWVPLIGNVRTMIMDEAHVKRYSIHPGADKMYYDLRDIACVIDFGGCWDTHLPLPEFSYKNSYHLSIRCAPFEALYERLRAARNHQKSYVNNRRKPLEFEDGDRVFLKVSPWKGTIQFRKEGKLAPRYVGTFEILKRIGLVVYRLRFPQELKGIHDTFHVSKLKKCLANASLHVPLEEIEIDKTLRFVEEPVEIMDREIKKLKRSKI
nr:putative reverse transcriptase domain-containing protein [Tanacetum cinerariifolium]